MADQLAVIVGIGVTSFLLFYLANSFGDSKNDIGRQVVQLLSIMFAVLFLLMIPQTLYTNDFCETVVANSTAITNSTVSYEYERFCFTEQNSSMSVFYRASLIFFRVFVLLLLLRIGWLIIKSLYEATKARIR